MNKIEKDSCISLLNFFNENTDISNNEIDIAIKICSYFRKMINEMHNGVVKTEDEITKFYNFFKGNETLIYELDNKLNELICQRLFDVDNFCNIFNSNNSDEIKNNLAYQYLPFKDSNIEVEKNIFSKLFKDESIKNSYKSLINALLFNIYDNKYDDNLVMDTILKVDSFIFKENINYNFFIDNSITKRK